MLRGRRLSWWCIAAGVLALGLGVGLREAGPAEASARRAGAQVQLVSGSGSQSMTFTLRRRGPHALVLAGELNLTFENDTATPQRLRVFYAAASSTEVRSLPGLTLPARALKQLHIRLRLPANAAPSRVDGTLSIRVVSPSRPRHGDQEFTVRLTGKLKPIGDVRFSPPRPFVQATLWCPFALCNASSGGTVRLQGTGVGELLSQMRAAGVSVLVTQLRRSGAKPITATVSGLSAVPGSAGAAIGKLSFANPSGAGRYSGALPLSKLVAHAPSWRIEVKARVWVVWAVLLIFAGVISAGLVTQQLGLRRRKELLRGALKDVVDDYVDMRDKNRDDTGGTLIWDLGIEDRLRDSKSWTYFTPLDSAENIYTAVRWARNDQDLDEAQALALSLMTNIRSWQAALAAVRALWELRRDQREDPSDWRGTNCAFDTDLVLLKARHAPLDETTSSKLLDQVRQQTVWHRSFAEAWDLRTRILAADPNSLAHKVDLAALDGRTPHIWSRSQEEQDERAVELERDYADLLKERRDLSPGVRLPELPATELEAQAAEFNADVRLLRSASETPTLAIAELAARRALTSDGGAGAVPTPPSSTAGEPDALARTSVGARRRGSLVQAAPERLAQAATAVGGAVGPGRLLHRLRLTDSALSLAIALLSSTVYTATIYGDTWGSLTDLATAFGAGFTGQVAVKWGVLPIYQSIRLRATPTAATQAEGTVSGSAPAIG
jgi:hypothetical protein